MSTFSHSTSKKRHVSLHTFNFVEPVNCQIDKSFSTAVTSNKEKQRGSDKNGTRKQHYSSKEKTE
jgi:hypothetical protein